MEMNQQSVRNGDPNCRVHEECKGLMVVLTLYGLVYEVENMPLEACRLSLFLDLSFIWSAEFIACYSIHCLALPFVCMILTLLPGEMASSLRLACG